MYKIDLFRNVYMYSYKWTMCKLSTVYLKSLYYSKFDVGDNGPPACMSAPLVSYLQKNGHTVYWFMA